MTTELATLAHFMGEEVARLRYQMLRIWQRPAAHFMSGSKVNEAALFAHGAFSPLGPESRAAYGQMSVS